MTRTFEAKPAVRQAKNLFIGLSGPSSSGKTLSAIRIALGIQRVTGGEIFYIDSENRRATAYADTYKFQHVQFDAPYGSLDYVEAIKYCEAKGASIIVIDSASHEHEGEGGMLEFQEAEVQRMAGDDAGKRERVKMLAWQRPKAARRKLLRKIITSKANIIMCFRAKHTSKPVKKDGKTEVVDQGFVPIAGEEFVYEMELSAFLPANSQGVPRWHPENPGEKLATKIPRYLQPFIKDDEQLSEEIGQRLAEWARGGASPKPTSAPAAADRDSLVKTLKTAASYGSASLRKDWEALSKADKHLVGADELAILKSAAEQADAD